MRKTCPSDPFGVGPAVVRVGRTPGSDEACLDGEADGLRTTARCQGALPGPGLATCGLKRRRQHSVRTFRTIRNMPNVSSNM